MKRRKRLTPDAIVERAIASLHPKPKGEPLTVIATVFGYDSLMRVHVIKGALFWHYRVERHQLYQGKLNPSSCWKTHERSSGHWTREGCERAARNRMKSLEKTSRQEPDSIQEPEDTLLRE